MHNFTLKKVFKLSDFPKGTAEIFVEDHWNFDPYENFKLGLELGKCVLTDYLHKHGAVIGETVIIDCEGW